MTGRARRFALVGAAAAALSIALFAVALALGVPAQLATALRLAVALPILYLGYARWVLADLRAADRARHGRAAAELRMLLRVAAAVGTSAALKLALEPQLALWLAARVSPAAAAAAPLAGELGYGPLASYLVLTARRRCAPQGDGGRL
jgi:putative flippase GtrA